VGFVLLDLLFYEYVFSIVVCPLVLFILTIVLSVLLRYTDSDNPFDIIKLSNHRVLLSLKRKYKKENCVTGCLLKFDNRH